MSYNTPITPTNTSPKGLDVVINAINDNIILPWLTKFGKTYTKDNAPIIREFGKNEYKILTPNDTLLVGTKKAVSFWKVSEDFTQLNWEKATNMRTYSRECTLIVWANLNKLYPTNPTLAGENLISDILASLKPLNNDFVVTDITDGVSAWADYTVADEHYFELPYHTIAITGTIIYTYNAVSC